MVIAVKFMVDLHLFPLLLYVVRSTLQFRKSGTSINKDSCSDGVPVCTFFSVFDGLAHSLWSHDI